MISSFRNSKPRLTVKISNMKRSPSRDSPPLRSKRSRSSMRRYDDSSDERVTPERIRRRSPRGRSPPSPRRYALERDDYRSRGLEKAYPSFKVLCVSALHPKASDELIKDTLYREFKKFGDLSIRISHDLDERLAYVCFRSSEDARDAKHNKSRIILFDKVALVEPVFEKRSSAELYRGHSRPRSRSITPEYDRYYRRSPVPDHHRPLPPDRIYDRGYPPPVPLPPHRGEFIRREGPILPPHDPFLPRGPPLHPHHHPHPLPPHHLPPGPHGPYGPPRHMMIPHFKPPPHHFVDEMKKKDKFPNYLHHVPPEEDPLATRTLFAGNLEIGITEEELRRIFNRYGIVEDIDIKRPLPGTGNAYAFVRYQNLDMAHRAKVELSGQYIGKFQCKIGYGKATPTTKIWVGGLGPWTSISQLEREFDRFGAIQKIDYVKGDTQAYILYNSIDAATAAVKEMRGFALGGPEHKLRIDFADVANYPGKSRSSYPEDMASGAGDFRSRSSDFASYDSPYDPWTESDPYGSRVSRGRGSNRRGGYRDGYDDDLARHPDYDRMKSEPRSRSRSPKHRSMDSDSGSESGRANGILGSSRTLVDLARRCISVWSGALILKNSLFPAKFHLTDGDPEVVDTLMKDETGKHLLRITQRLRLDQPKLEDVSKRIATSNSHAIFLGLPSSGSSITSDDASVQTRPLRNLVSYLKQKEAAGVISLIQKDTEVTGVLYAFPPCAFSAELLKRTAHSLTEDSLKEDHLVVVVVRGGTA
nr:PREDICTED: putative RNA-binding protein 15 [Bemisia tabaci]